MGEAAEVMAAVEERLCAAVSAVCREDEAAARAALVAAGVWMRDGDDPLLACAALVHGWSGARVERRKIELGRGGPRHRKAREVEQVGGSAR